MSAPPRRTKTIHAAIAGAVATCIREYHSTRLTRRSGPRPSISLRPASRHQLPLLRLAEWIDETAVADRPRRDARASQGRSPPPSSSRRRAVGQCVSDCTTTSCGMPTQASSSDQLLPAVPGRGGRATGRSGTSFASYTPPRGDPGKGGGQSLQRLSSRGVDTPASGCPRGRLAGRVEEDLRQLAGLIIQARRRRGRPQDAERLDRLLRPQSGRTAGGPPGGRWA